MPKISNAFTIDVEDYFMVSAFESQIPKSEWDRLPSRVVQNTRKILSVLKEFEVQSTFFVLGWVAERYPNLVREIHEQGHEIACHGYDHQLVYNQTPKQFRSDIRLTKEILEKICKTPILGYRAPSFSIVPETEWALKILQEEGFKYDASIFPAPHARGGFSGAPRQPHLRDGLPEFPMSVLRLAGRNFGFSGGGYFRLLPYSIVRWGIRSSHKQNYPAVIYLHPWEFDPDQPRIKSNLISRIKHYVNLHKTSEKVRQLLKDFKFESMQSILSKSDFINMQ